jgi:hypothetical protein
MLLPQVMVPQLIFSDALENVSVLGVFHRARQPVVDDMFGYFTFLQSQNFRFYFLI